MNNRVAKVFDKLREMQRHKGKKSMNNRITKVFGKLERIEGYKGAEIHEQ